MLRIGKLVVRVRLECIRRTLLLYLHSSGKKLFGVRLSDSSTLLTAYCDLAAGTAVATALLGLQLDSVIVFLPPIIVGRVAFWRSLIRCPLFNFRIPV